MWFSNSFWGVKLWIWLYFGCSIFLGGVVLLYWFREAIKKHWWALRFPEKLIHVFVHFKGQMFKEYWRLIPDENELLIEGKIYRYSDQNLVKLSDSFVKEHKNRPYMIIEGIRYEIDDKLFIRNRWRAFPEIHYFYNIPSAIEFDFTKAKAELSSKQLEEFKENDLFAKLLTLDAERNMMMFILILGVVNFLGVLFIIAKLMGWLSK